MKKIIKYFLAMALVIVSSGLYAQQISSWQIHEGNEGVINHVGRFNGDPMAYTKMAIPAKADRGWKETPKDANGNVYLDRSSTLKCLQQLDFTYFQTTVNIPANVLVNEFKISYDKADDGARIYFFNSKFPNGTFDPKADLVISQSRDNVGSINLKDRVAPGENRVVIVQFDDCADRNSVHNIKISVNGREIKPVSAPASVPVNVSEGITVYEHANFGGRSKTFGVGSHDITSIEFNDIISSLKIPKGYKVMLYKDWKFTGQSITLTADNRDLKTLKFNGIVSSLVVEKVPAATAVANYATAVALPDKFKVHAFSVNEGKKEKDAYWFALRAGNTRGAIINEKQLVNGTKWMEIERVDLGNSVFAFKVMNAGANMYLIAGSNKEVHVGLATPNAIPDGAKFKSVTPLTAAPGSNNYRSFESVKFTGHYLRHAGYLLFVHTNNNTELFKQDASWQIQKM